MDSSQPSWTHTPAAQKIASHQIHIWRAALDATALQTEQLQAFLSADEIARADRFHFEKDRLRYIVARGTLRQILGLYLKSAPHALQFDYTHFGKPFLPSETAKIGINFNLSHSGDMVLYAITRGQCVGIDLEKINPTIAIEQIAQRFFSPAEITALHAAPGDQRDQLFFLYWTRKEAILKATGKGVAFPLEKVNVSQQANHGWSPVLLSDDSEKKQQWFTQDLFPDAGYQAAIAVEKNNCELFFFSGMSDLHSLSYL
jgi:4'-phosphopantetheinyl transferase